MKYTVEFTPDAEADLADIFDYLSHYRQVVHKQYRVIYRIAASRVEVLLVADGRRDFRAQFKERLKP